MVNLMCKNYFHYQGHSYELFVNNLSERQYSIDIGTGFFFNLMIFYGGIIFKIHSNEAHFFCLEKLKKLET